MINYQARSKREFRRQKGRMPLSLLFVLVFILIVCSGVAFNSFFSFPDSEVEREKENLEYLGRLEGLSGEEYRAKEDDRIQFNTRRRNAASDVTDAINLQQNDKLPELMAELILVANDDYQRWPRIYHEAILADNEEAFRWFLQQKYPCEYSNTFLGRTAFETAINKKNIKYFDLLLKKGCDTRPAEYQERVDAILKQRRMTEWLEMLEGYQPWFLYE